MQDIPVAFFKYSSLRERYIKCNICMVEKQLFPYQVPILWFSFLNNVLQCNKIIHLQVSYFFPNKILVNLRLELDD